MREAGMIQEIPFSPQTRSSGVLVHITSLPSPHGIGDLGKAARRWIDRLADAAQHWWQMLPLSPAGRGNSPYMSLSTFALSELLVDPDDLIADGLLDRAQASPPDLPDEFVDFEAVSQWKRRVIDLARSAFRKERRREDLLESYDQFRVDQAHWLDDYALFVTLRDESAVDHYLDWPSELAHRDPGSLKAARSRLADAVDRCCFAQFMLFRQAAALKKYAAERQVRLIGDLPFFISPASAEVWANPELLMLDDRYRPKFVGGVPPDYFSADGQLWGNPVYDWPVHRRTNYRWWIARVRALLDQVDVIRIDHFRGLAAAWHVPAESLTAKSGEWVPGPGAELLDAVRGALGGLPLIAEDLGSITDDVVELRDQFRMPGMRVLQFAFDGDPTNPFLPENFESNTVAYTGTHDNDTTRGWYASLSPRERRVVQQSLGWPDVHVDEAAWRLLEVVWKSSAAAAIAPLQDVLNLGQEARMNIPGRPDNNWKWRCPESLLDAADFSRLRTLSEQTHRIGNCRSVGND